MMRVDKHIAVALHNMLQENRGQVMELFALSEERAMEMSQSLEDQLYGDEENYEGLLVDQMARVLMREGGRNALSGDGLRQLRRAILIPAERIGLEASLKAKWSCPSCGRAFANGEMAVSNTRGDTPEILCTRCSMPSIMACGDIHCKDGKVPVPESIIKVIQKRKQCEATPAAPSSPETSLLEQFRSFSGQLVNSTPVWRTLDGGVASAPMPAEPSMWSAEPFGDENEDE